MKKEKFSKKELSKKGVLYIVATPIGNLEDITLRALRVLKEVDLIAAEDTRHTLKLLSHYQIKNKITSYHEHNKIEKDRYIVDELLLGKDVALVSDAGTPGISDPGEGLIKLAIEKGINVTMTPGPTAAIMGLALSGLGTKQFVFDGFLPSDKKEREKRILSLKNEIRTIILYEAPHRLLSTLEDLDTHFRGRKISLGRELTKKFEEIIRCSIPEAIERFKEKKPRGEFVLILEGASEKDIIERARQEWENIGLEDHMNIYTLKGLNRKEAMKKVGKDRGMTRREVYNKLHEIKRNEEI